MYLALTVICSQFHIVANERIQTMGSYERQAHRWQAPSVFAWINLLVYSVSKHHSFNSYTRDESRRDNKLADTVPNRDL